MKLASRFFASRVVSKYKGIDLSFRRRYALLAVEASDNTAAASA
jgi:hypothetical protein